MVGKHGWKQVGQEKQQFYGALHDSFSTGRKLVIEDVEDRGARKCVGREGLGMAGRELFAGGVNQSTQGSEMGGAHRSHEVGRVRVASEKGA